MEYILFSLVWFYGKYRRLFKILFIHKIPQVESFLHPDKQGTPEEGRGIQRPKRFEKNDNDEDNSPKTLTDKYHRAWLRNSDK